jgi:hypothetical protein
VGPWGGAGSWGNPIVGFCDVVLRAWRPEVVRPGGASALLLVVPFLPAAFFAFFCGRCASALCGGTFFGGAFLAAAFFAGTFLAARFAVALRAGLFLPGTLCAAAFLAGVFFAGVRFSAFAGAVERRTNSPTTGSPSVLTVGYVLVIRMTPVTSTTAPIARDGVIGCADTPSHP